MIKINDMSDSVYDNKINKHTNWSGDLSTGGLPVTGDRVQEFIKSTLESKAGSFLYRKESNSYIVFSDKEDREKYIEREEFSEDLIIDEISLPDPMVTMTEDEYDNLSNKDPNTYYFIKED